MVANKKSGLRGHGPAHFLKELIDLSCIGATTGSMEVDLPSSVCVPVEKEQGSDSLKDYLALLGIVFIMPWH